MAVVKPPGSQTTGLAVSCVKGIRGLLRFREFRCRALALLKIVFQSRVSKVSSNLNRGGKKEGQGDRRVATGSREILEVGMLAEQDLEMKKPNVCRRDTGTPGV